MGYVTEEKKEEVKKRKKKEEEEEEKKKTKKKHQGLKGTDASLAFTWTSKVLSKADARTVNALLASEITKRKVLNLIDQLHGVNTRGVHAGAAACCDAVVRTRDCTIRAAAGSQLLVIQQGPVVPLRRLAQLLQHNTPSAQVLVAFVNLLLRDEGLLSEKDPLPCVPVMARLETASLHLNPLHDEGWVSLTRRSTSVAVWTFTKHQKDVHSCADQTWSAVHELARLKGGQPIFRLLGFTGTDEFNLRELRPFPGKTNDEAAMSSVLEYLSEAVAAQLREAGLQRTPSLTYRVAEQGTTAVVSVCWNAFSRSLVNTAGLAAMERLLGATARRTCEFMIPPASLADHTTGTARGVITAPRNVLDAAMNVVCTQVGVGCGDDIRDWSSRPLRVVGSTVGDAVVEFVRRRDGDVAAQKIKRETAGIDFGVVEQAPSKSSLLYVSLSTCVLVVLVHLCCTKLVHQLVGCTCGWRSQGHVMYRSYGSPGSDLVETGYYESCSCGISLLLRQRKCSTAHIALSIFCKMPAIGHLVRISIIMSRSFVLIANSVASFQRLHTTSSYHANARPTQPNQATLTY